MTQGEFASWLGCSKRAVIAWENDQNPIPGWVAARLASDTPLIQPRFSLDEYAKLQKKADEAGTDVNGFIEQLIKKSLLFIMLAGIVSMALTGDPLPGLAVGCEVVGTAAYYLATAAVYAVGFAVEVLV